MTVPRFLRYPVGNSCLNAVILRDAPAERRHERWPHHLTTMPFEALIWHHVRLMLRSRYILRLLQVSTRPTLNFRVGYSKLRIKKKPCSASSNVSTRISLISCALQQDARAFYSPKGTGGLQLESQRRVPFGKPLEMRGRIFFQCYSIVLLHYCEDLSSPTPS